MSLCLYLIYICISIYLIYLIEVFYIIFIFSIKINGGFHDSSMRQSLERIKID